MHAAFRTVPVAGIKITVREITVSEIREWLINAEQTRTDVVGQAVLDDISIDEICRCSNLTERQAGKLTPSELSTVAEVCKELNSHFFALRDRINSAPVASA